jgi:hypothetical protein
MGHIIEETKCETAAEFLELLSPFHRNSVWPGGGEGWWFRGQSQDWPLHPKAMRPDALVHQGMGVSPGIFRPQTVHDQVEFESGAVMTFGNDCIRFGRRLPEDGQWLRSAVLQEQVLGETRLEEYGKGKEFPPPMLRSVYALAQHHGVVTRLLDWSYDVMVAAYFACEGVARAAVLAADGGKTKGSERLIVWGLRTLAFDYLADFAAALRLEKKTFDPVLARVEAPYAENPRLAAQRGAFSLVVHAEVPEPTKLQLPSVDELLREYARRFLEGMALDEMEHWPFARRVTLPHTEARRLLRLLGEAGISAASVYPDYDGIVLGHQERRFWK